MLARVFNQQDVDNLAKVQIGLKAMKKSGDVTFGSYGEAKIRHFHQLYDHWLDLA